MNYRIEIAGKPATLSTDSDIARNSVPVLLISSKAYRPRDLFAGKQAGAWLADIAGQTLNRDLRSTIRAYLGSEPAPMEVCSIRIAPQVKAMFQRAAESKNQTLSNWIVQTCLKSLGKGN